MRGGGDRQRSLPADFLPPIVTVLVLDVDVMHGLWIVYVQHPRLHNETEVKLIGY